MILPVRGTASVVGVMSGMHDIGT